MHLPTFATLALSLLAGSAAADSWHININCSHGNGCYGNNGIWYFANGQAYIGNFDDGCRNNPLGGVRSFCVDWNNKRGHFDMASGDWRRCMKEMEVRDQNNGWWWARWEEVACTWPTSRAAAAAEGLEGGAGGAESAAEGEGGEGGEETKRALVGSAKFQV